MFDNHIYRITYDAAISIFQFFLLSVVWGIFLHHLTDWLSSCAKVIHNGSTSQSVYEYTNCCLYRGWGLKPDASSERCLNPAPSLQIRSPRFFWRFFSQYRLLPQACKHISTLISSETLLWTPQKYSPREISKALPRPCVRACVVSQGGEPALMLECLPLHSLLARSRLWQMARGEVKSEQAERGGMSVVASRFVSCYLPFAVTRALHAWSTADWDVKARGATQRRREERPASPWQFSGSC